MLSRRKVLRGLGGCCLIASPLAAAQDRVTLTPQLWAGWLGEWRSMQDQVRQRGWDLVRLDIDAPASETEIRRVETRHGLTVPAQLREILLHRSAQVRFGWSIPPLLRPLEGLNLPTSGGLRDRLWSLDHIDQKAIVSFNRLRKEVAHLGDGEEPNAPEMWDNQFPFAVIGNGDILTIDMSPRGGQQPVRYFGSDRDGLHHRFLLLRHRLFAARMRRRRSRRLVPLHRHGRW
jgi:SMI1/KNR4 family protein SUKH-1